MPKLEVYPLFLLKIEQNEHNARFEYGEATDCAGQFYSAIGEYYYEKSNEKKAELANIPTESVKV